MSKKIFIVLGLLVGLTCSSQAANIYVAANNIGTLDGTSWLTAYDNLDTALAAAVSGDTVYVARGKYVPSGASFTVPAGITIKGGYSNYILSYGATTDIGEGYNPNNYPTVLSGDTNNDDAYCNLYADPEALNAHPSRVDNKATIMRLLGDATIDGLFFMNSGTTMSTTENGAIYCSVLATITINNCQFYANVGNRASAVYATSSSGSVTISNCFFEGNATYQNVIRCTSLNLTVAKCMFKGNSNGVGNGSGVRWSTAANGTFTVTDCLFVDQISNFGTGGGSLYVSGGATNCTSNISKCVFRNDSSGWGGCTYLYNSGTASVQTWNFTNCLWTGCREGTNNGIILIRPNNAPDNVSTFNMTNCTVADNISTGGAVAGIKLYAGAALKNTSVAVNIKNSILWGNTGAQVNWDTTSCTFTDTTYNPFNISYSCIDTTDPNNYPAIGYFKPIPTGLVVADPLFVGNGDYHLQSTSPCIDKGDPASAYANEPKWLNGCRVNMGAYGNTKEAATTATCVALSADITGDCKVNTADLLQLRSQWLRTCP